MVENLRKVIRRGEQIEELDETASEQFVFIPQCMILYVFAGQPDCV